MHQMVIVFPLGLLVTGAIFDLVRLVTGNEIFGQVGFWNITAGLVGAIVAAVTGWLDWTSIPAGTRAKRIGLLHGTLNGLVLVLFGIAWLLRLDGTHQPGALPFTLEVLALVAGSIAAWFGGELVDRLGIGVHEDAHPDAASSLSR
ncbi:DUF2231 domain-containing protein [Catenuloplanes niger JCM 9533]